MVYCQDTQIFNDLKENVFKALEGYMPLEEFEAWLYASEELSNLMNHDVVLEAYSFNYKQPDTRYYFKSAIFKYFDEDEFALWKVKSNLRDLIENRYDRDRILYDFYYLAKDRYDFLLPIGYYTYYIEDIKYIGRPLEAVLAELKYDCGTLLLEIEKQELEKPGFKLADYRSRK